MACLADQHDIKVLFSDVDGTLTDGLLYFGAQGEELKAFYVKDGLGIKSWVKSDRTFGMLSNRESPMVSRRARELGVAAIAQGVADKYTWVKEYLSRNNLDWQHLAFIGDDVNDIDVLQAAQFSGAPSDSTHEVQKIVKFGCTKAGGHGAVREFIDYLLRE